MWSPEQIQALEALAAPPALATCDAEQTFSTPDATPATPLSASTTKAERRALQEAQRAAKAAAAGAGSMFTPELQSLKPRVAWRTLESRGFQATSLPPAAFQAP